MSNVVQFKKGDSTEKTTDPTTNLLYLLLSMMPMTELETTINIARSGDFVVDSDDSYNFAKKLAAKIVKTA